MIDKELFKSLIRSGLKISVSGSKWSIYFSKRTDFELNVGKFNASFILNNNYVHPINNFEDDSILLAKWFNNYIAIEDFLTQVCVLGELENKGVLEIVLLENSKANKAGSDL